MITYLFFLIEFYLLINLMICVEGRIISFARFPMPTILRKIIFYMPRCFHKFTLHGVILSVYSHIMLIVTLIIVVNEQNNWDSVSNELYALWILSWLYSMMILAIHLCWDLLFQKKKRIKKAKSKNVPNAYDFTEFYNGKIIKEVVVSERIKNNPKGVVLMLPTALSIDYQGNLVDTESNNICSADNKYYFSFGNYEEMSVFLNAEGYATIRLNFIQTEDEKGYYSYVAEVKEVVKILDEKYKFGTNLMLLCHGAIGSMVALEMVNEFLIKRIIMLGGANVTPYEEACQTAKYYHETFDMSEVIIPFWKEILKIKTEDALKKIERISIPTLVIFTSENIVYNGNCVKALEQIRNPNIEVKRLLGTTSVWMEGDLSECNNGIYAVKNGSVLTVSKRVKKAIREWLALEEIR